MLREKVASLPSTSSPLFLKGEEVKQAEAGKGDEEVGGKGCGRRPEKSGAVALALSRSQHPPHPTPWAFGQARLFFVGATFISILDGGAPQRLARSLLPEMYTLAPSSAALAKRRVASATAGKREIALTRRIAGWLGQGGKENFRICLRNL